MSRQGSKPPAQPTFAGLGGSDGPERSGARHFRHRLHASIPPPMDGEPRATDRPGVRGSPFTATTLTHVRRPDLSEVCRTPGGSEMKTTVRSLTVRRGRL